MTRPRGRSDRVSRRKRLASRLLLAGVLAASARAQGENATSSTATVQGDGATSSSSLPAWRDNATTSSLQAPKLAAQYGPNNPRQVRIHAQILEWTHDSQIDWGFSILYAKLLEDRSGIVRSADMTFPKQGGLSQGLAVFLDNLSVNNGEGSFEAVIEALEQRGEVRVLSEPYIIVPNARDTGQPALPRTVTTKSRIPYEAAQAVGNTLAQITLFKDTSTQLTVAVEDIQEDFVRILVNTSVTSLSGFVAVALNNQGDPMLVPRTNTRSMSNTILIRNGATFIGGALKTSTSFQREQGVPWLATVPWVGYLFKNQQRRNTDQELLFLIRPEIIAN
ncbi:MAG TPA: type II and III secretion system protein [Sumerlaeia bacterium]|nr:type II and III secretion system protein [Sumerlaeia bacterium]